MSLTKAEFRSYCLKRMNEATRHNKRYKDALVMNQLQWVLKNIHAKRILFYWPLVIEADLRKLLHVSRKKSEVYLPFMVGESFKMVAYRLPLERKKFGIFEPGQSFRNITKIDIAIVPAVGVDGRTRRIGFGKGMYDRFFENLPKRPLIIFVQPEICKTSQYICDRYDISADLLVTPRRLYGVRGNKHVGQSYFNAKRTVCRWQRCHR